MGYVVTAGYVTVETAVPGGRAQIDVPCGAELPGDVPDEQVQTLLARGDIGPAEEPAEPEADTGSPDESADESEETPDGPPPKGGPGSGADAWTAYAHVHGVAVPEGANREQIRALLTEHGIPVE